MPGFLGEISRSRYVNKNFGKNIKEDLINQMIEAENYYLERRTIKKFEHDKVFIEDDEYITITEGVILNSLKLIEKYKTNTLRNTIVKMYEINGDTFFDEFKGSFSGLLYDKRKDKWIIYTNHYGDKQIFYTKAKDKIIFGSEINYLVNYMRNNNIKYQLDTIGVYFLLTYGFMLEDYTLFKEIKKLNAGKYIKIENNNFEILTYYEIDNTPIYSPSASSDEEIIENIDKLFRNAVKLEFEKDKEYNYKHVVTLSGGLDSRISTWVAHDLGYVEQLNVTFSQTDYLDETIAKEIARDLKHEWLFKALDNGNYLKNFEEMIKLNSGNFLYSGNAHVNNFVCTFNFDSYGLYHSGQLGDVILGTYYSSENSKKSYIPGDGAYSKKLIRVDEEKYLKYNYINEEIFKFYNRGFNGIFQGALPVQNYSEISSPFLDVDFFNYCLKIPLKYRYNHRIYFKWILKKYPSAAKYKWEAINGKITEKIYNIMGYKTTLKSLPIKAYDKIFHKSSLNTKRNMNPINYWYKNNNDLREFFLNTFNENISLISDKELKNDCQILFKEGNITEKAQVLTFLGTYKYYFTEYGNDQKE